jgi:hypothetical protein
LKIFENQLARFRKPKIVENKRQKTKKKQEHKRGRKKKKRRDNENPRQLLLRINTPLNILKAKNQTECKPLVLFNKKIDCIMSSLQQTSSAHCFSYKELF